MAYNYSYINGGDSYIKCPECGNECLMHNDGNYECQVCGHSGYEGEEYDAPYELTKFDKKYLKSIGYLDEDLAQIEDAANNAKYALIDGVVFERYIDSVENGVRYMNREYVIQRLGKKVWLGALGRCAFHCSAARYNKTNTFSVIFEYKW